MAPPSSDSLLYAMYMFEERFRNEGGKFFDADTMKATINSDVGVKVFTGMRKRRQIHAARRRAVRLRGESSRLSCKANQL